MPEEFPIALLLNAASSAATPSPPALPLRPSSLRLPAMHICWRWTPRTQATALPPTKDIRRRSTVEHSRSSALFPSIDGALPASEKYLASILFRLNYSRIRNLFLPTRMSLPKYSLPTPPNKRVHFVIVEESP